ncbi:uracil-DNA glycosylase [Zymomonas mobilis subsp. pomaceae]|nr:uracil-DNA glycosylase [Zymomonas mobilis subsp. pomaceae]
MTISRPISKTKKLSPHKKRNPLPALKTPIFSNSPLRPDPDCPLCPRLADFRHALQLSHPAWFNAPVPPFGDPDPWLAIIGLAPGMRGANRTGRPFTGDFAGILLYETLIHFGLATGTYEEKIDDSLQLKGVSVLNAVRCLPPANKPTPLEITTCRPFLQATLQNFSHLKIILALGQIAHQTILRHFNIRLAEMPFKHGAEYPLPSGLRLIDSYHCSRYNQNTKRLTPDMFQAIFKKIMTYYC